MVQYNLNVFFYNLLSSEIELDVNLKTVIDLNKKTKMLWKFKCYRPL